MLCMEGGGGGFGSESVVVGGACLCGESLFYEQLQG